MKKLISLILIFVCVLNSAGCTSQKEYVYVDFLDVGNADCIVIRTENRTTVIDTATSILSDIIFEYLNEKEIDRIDILIITHFDKDHVGGASEVIENFETSHIIMPDYVSTSDEYKTFKN